MIEILRSITYLLKVNELFSFWRSANSQVREDVTFTMKSIFKDRDLNRKQVTLTEQMSGLDDDGELNDFL